MSHITVMGWNIENFGTTKHKKVNGGPELITLIAKVISENNVDVAGFCEIRANLGDDIGRELVAELGGTAAGWTHLQSPAFGKGRWEQYLFVWNTNKVISSQPFQHSFLNPSPPPVTLGFPLQSHLDRPPFLAFFQTVTTPQKQVRVAMIHSPAPSPALRPCNAARNVAKVVEINSGGDACVVLGDFNVKASVDAGVPGTPGHAAFGDLVRTAGFVQKLPDGAFSSLIPKRQAWTHMSEDDCKSQPYDQIFCRTATTGITFQNEGVEDLIVECVPRTATGLISKAGKNYLGPSLADLHAKNNSGSAPAAYNTVEDAFQAFRVYVSDHLPVVVEVHH